MIKKRESALQRQVSIECRKSLRVDRAALHQGVRARSEGKYRRSLRIYIYIEMGAFIIHHSPMKTGRNYCIL